MIVAAVVVATTGWTYADPLIGAGIGVFMLPRTFKLCAQAVRILIEAAPPQIDVEALRAALLQLPGVADVHDLHVWSLISGMDAASEHVVVEEQADPISCWIWSPTSWPKTSKVTHNTVQCEAPGHFDHQFACLS